MMMFVTGVCWAGGSKEIEIVALREAVVELQASNSALEAANSELNTALSSQDEAVMAMQTAITGYRDLMRLKDERLQVEVDLRTAAEARGDNLLAVVEKQKGKVGNIERIVWAGLVVTVAVAGVYGTVAASPVQVQF